MLTIKNIYKTYRDKKKPGNDVKALIDVSFTVEKGEFIAILGNSGSGKSTLMNILGGLDKPDSGKVYFDNTEITALSAARLANYRNRNVGFVFQSNFIEPRFTVLKNVCVPLIISGEEKDSREAKARKILNELGLYEEADRPAGKLSGGQLRRVCIARALVNNPDIILADEPTGSLDAELSDSVVSLLGEISERGITVLMVTHSPQAAEKTDRILHLDNGRLK